jgi:hypothetical protein
MPSIRPRTHRLVAVALPMVLLLGASLPVGAHGSRNPAYTAVAAPGSIPAGTSTVSTITLTAISPVDDGLGSVRVTAPAGFTVIGASAVQGTTPKTATVSGSSVTINDLRLRQVGKTLTITITTGVSCGVAGDTAWKVDGRTSTTYRSTSGRSVAPAAGSSLDVTVVPCRLEVLRQPALAAKDAVISSVAADPSGASVAVRLLDGTGAPASVSGVSVTVAIKADTGPAGAAIGGTTTGSTNANGVAAFAPTIDTPGLGYRLRASAGSGIEGTTTESFEIAAVAKTCSGACGGSDTRTTTTATIDAVTNGGLLTLSLGLTNVDCNTPINKYYQATSEPLLFNVTQATGRTVVTMRIAAASVDRRYDKYQVCFSSPESTFKNRYGVRIGVDEAGVLPDCWWYGFSYRTQLRTRKPGHVTNAQACVEKRWKDHSGNVYVRFSVPPGDPRAKI